MKLVLAATALLTTVMTTAHSADAESAPTATEALADEAGVDAVDLRGAANSTGLTPRRYLESVGELVASDALARGVSEDGGRASQAAPVSAQAACIIGKESGGLDVYNRQGSGAAGPGQYFPGTWAAHVGLYRAATGYTEPLSLHDLSDVQRVMTWVLAAYPRMRSAWTVGGCP